MSRKTTLIPDITIVVLMVLFLGLQFIPYFYYKEEEFSIMKFLWLNAAEMKKFGIELYGKSFSINQAADFLVLSQMLAVVIMVISLWIPTNVWTMIADVAWAFCATYGFVTNSLLRATNTTAKAWVLDVNRFWIYLPLIIVIDLVIIWRGIQYIPGLIKKFDE